MALGREVQDVGDAMPRDHGVDSQLVAQVHLFEAILRMRRNSPQVGGIGGVGKAIEIHEHGELGAIDDLLNQVRADESAASGDEKVHGAKRSTTSFAPRGTGVSD